MYCPALYSGKAEPASGWRRKTARMGDRSSQETTVPTFRSAMGPLRYQPYNRSTSPMLITVPKESLPGERRVGLVPELVPRLAKTGAEVVMQTGAGEAAGFPDAAYTERGARVESE